MPAFGWAIACWLPMMPEYPIEGEDGKDMTCLTPLFCILNWFGLPVPRSCHYIMPSTASDLRGDGRVARDIYLLVLVLRPGKAANGHEVGGPARGEIDKVALEVGDAEGGSSSGQSCQVEVNHCDRLSVVEC